MDLARTGFRAMAPASLHCFGGDGDGLVYGVSGIEDELYASFILQTLDKGWPGSTKSRHFCGRSGVTDDEEHR